MAGFSSELSGSLIFSSASSTAALLPYNGGINISGSELYINEVGLDSRIQAIEAGNAGTASLSPLNRHSASVDLFTASMEAFRTTTDSKIGSIHTFTASIATRVSDLEASNEDYLTTDTLPTGIVSSSIQIENLGYLTSASAASSGFGEATLPAGTISSSQQISTLGFITSSDSSISASFSTTASYIDPLFISESAAFYGFGAGGEDTPDGTISSSAQILELGFITSSETVIPAGTISSSQQISALGFITSYSETDTSALGVIHNYTASTDDRLAAIEAATSSYTTGSHTSVEALNTFTSSYYLDSASFASRIDNVTGSSDNTALNTFTSSIQSQVDSLTLATSSYLTSLPSGLVSSSNQITDGSGIVSGSVLRTLDGTGVLSGSKTDISSLNIFTSSYYVDSASFASRINNVTGSSDNTALNTFTSSYYVDSASFDSRINSISAGDTSYDGDRIISNEDLGDLYSNSFNAGTSGSIQDFLNAVFFPNTAPTFNTPVNQEVTEFAASGSTLVTLSATDSEGQPVSFAAASSYTDGFVTIASDGTVTLAVVPTEVNFNTEDRGDGTLAHPVEVDVTDSFGSTTTQTYYFTVNVNTAPKFRQTSTSGTVITSFNENRNENASSGLVGRIYFTDDEGDAITITSASDSNGHFTLTKYSTYVQIDQVTGSLDYENITSYTMSITASDEHYPSQDADSITTLPITINVTDNLQPTINNQTLNSINEDSSAGATVDTITASDNEGDTRTFFDFTLSKLELDNVDVSIGTYGGTSQASDPTENPFQMNSSGVVTRKAGIYLNSDLINEYQYSVKVKDSFNTASNSATITIPIADDPAPFIYDNWSGGPYVIESATTGEQIKTNSNGFSGTQARVTSNESVTWSTNSSLILVSSTGYLSMNTDVSGSYTAGQSFQADITASNSFGTANNTLITFTVTENLAPVLTLTDLGLNAEAAISGANIASVTITDQESNTPYSVALSGTDGGSFDLVSQNAANSSLYIQPTGSLEVGTYDITVTATDTFDKIGSSSLSIDVTAAADYGKFYIYTSTRTGGGTLNSGNYNGLLGIAGVDSSTPPEITSFTADTTSPVYKIKSGDLGNTTITVGGGTLTRRAIASGSSPSSIIQNIGQFSGDGSTAEQILLIYPSGSDMTGIPLAIAESFGGSDVGDYVLNVNDAGAWANTINGANLNLLQIDTAHEGYDHWYILGRTGTNTASTFEARLTAESGSAPTS